MRRGRARWRSARAGRARGVWLLAAIGLAAAALWWADRRGVDPLDLIPAAWRPELEGRVCRLDRVMDGDSLMLDCAGEPLEVRLHCIDAPERDQRPWGKQSWRHLRRIAPRELRVQEVELDRFGRTVAELYSLGPEPRMLNLEQVQSGQAAVYGRYCEDPRFFRAEREARAAGLGIWSSPGEQQRPWVFRHRKQR